MTTLAEIQAMPENTDEEIEAKAKAVKDEMKRRIDLVSSDFFQTGEFSVCGAFIMMADTSLNSYISDSEQIDLDDFD